MHPSDLAEGLKDDERLRELGDRVDALVPTALRDGQAAGVLRGEPLGHPLHPVMTDLPIGAFMSATMLDVVGRGKWATASSFLTGLGLAAVVPTAITGLTEWKETDAEERPVMLVHAGLNTVAAVLYATTIVARKRRAHTLASTLSVLATAATGVSGYLGGYLAYARGVGGPRGSSPAETNAAGGTSSDTSSLDYESGEGEARP